MSELDRQRQEVEEVMNIKPYVETDLEYAKRVSKEEVMNNQTPVYVDIDEETGTMIIVDNEEIKIPVYFTIDDETGITHYDTDSMRDEFEQAIKQLEANEQAELDGWNEKQQDYAMDNMTCDIAEEVYENM